MQSDTPSSPTNSSESAAEPSGLNELGNSKSPKANELPTNADIQAVVHRYMNVLGDMVREIINPGERLKLLGAMSRVFLVELLKFNMGMDDADAVFNYIEQFDNHTRAFMIRVRKEQAKNPPFQMKPDKGFSHKQSTPTINIKSDNVSNSDTGICITSSEVGSKEAVQGGPSQLLNISEAGRSEGVVVAQDAGSPSLVAPVGESDSRSEGTPLLRHVE